MSIRMYIEYTFNRCYKSHNAISFSYCNIFFLKPLYSLNCVHLKSAKLSPLSSYYLSLSLSIWTSCIVLIKLDAKAIILSQPFGRLLDDIKVQLAPAICWTTNQQGSLERFNDNIFCTLNHPELLPQFTKYERKYCRRWLC